MPSTSRVVLVAGLAALLSPLAAAAAPPPVEHRTVAGHPMQYELARPTGWKPGVRYPVVVVIPDAGRDFRGNLQAFVEARGDAPFLLVAPDVLTSGGATLPKPLFPYDAATWIKAEAAPAFAFDEAGVKAVLAEVEARDGGQPGAFLTGWEAGGHTVWALAFEHPGWWRGVAPVSANYQGRWLSGPSSPAGEPRPPLKVFFCDTLTGRDEQGRQFWFKQTAEATDAAVSRGFARPALEVLKGTPHGPQARAVLAWFSSLLPARK